MRIEGAVPEGQNSISYDFAFFTVEYPFYFGMPFNDMYIGWLESENWTGNISFDEMAIRSHSTPVSSTSATMVAIKFLSSRAPA